MTNDAILLRLNLVIALLFVVVGILLWPLSRSLLLFGVAVVVVGLGAAMVWSLTWPHS